MRHTLCVLAVLAASSGGCDETPPEPKDYDHKVETTVENGEVAQVIVWWPGLSGNNACTATVENYRDMDALITSTDAILAELKRIRQQMPEGESESPPSVIEPE